MKKITLKADDGMTVEVRVVEDTERDLPIGSAINLIPEWCKQDHDESNDFLCYPEDFACSCGIDKHHVHCGHGFVTQVG